MKTIERLQIEAAGEVFAQFGLPWVVHKGGKHLAMIVTAPDGSEHRAVMSGSPRDAAAVINFMRQDAYRLVEKMGIDTGRGVTTSRVQPHRRRRIKSTIQRYEVAIEPEDGPARDPWAVLKGLLP